MPREPALLASGGMVERHHDSDAERRNRRKLDER